MKNELNREDLRKLGGKELWKLKSDRLNQLLKEADEKGEEAVFSEDPFIKEITPIMFEKNERRERIAEMLAETQMGILTLGLLALSFYPPAEVIKSELLLSTGALSVISIATILELARQRKNKETKLAFNLE